MATTDSGLQINFIYAQDPSTLPAGFVSALNYAAQQIENVVTSPLSIAITISYTSPANAGELGETFVPFAGFDYGEVKNALANIDPTAAAGLPASDPVNSGGLIWISAAEAASLGLNNPTAEQLDYGSHDDISFSNAVSYTYDPNDRAVAGAYDFIGLAEHEITEALGRGDYFGSEAAKPGNIYTLLDLFHYTAPGSPTYTGTVQNYFSQDGGNTAGLNFNTSAPGDLGDWASPGDAFSAYNNSGQQLSLSPGDLTVLDALGFATGPASSGGTGETLTANDTAGQQLTGTPDNDTFYAGHNAVVMTGDGGNDTFVFQYLPWNAGSITDFNTTRDVLDLSGVLTSVGYAGSNPVGDGYLQFVSDGHDNTLVEIDAHQSSNPYPTLITTLDGISPASITPENYIYGSSSGGGSGGGTGGGSATVSVISTFSGDPEPNGTLAVDASGNLFGTTQSGGANSDGAVFEVANTGSGYAGTPTIIASFDGTDGQLPAAGLIADAAGNLFGVTSEGGANGDGTIFELANSADGYAATPTVLASFESSAVGPGNQLVKDAAGDLFGITEDGPFNATVFELAKTAGGYASAPTTLAQFNTPGTTSPLAIDASGDLFGVAISKSGPSTGSVFEIAHTADGYATTPTTLATLGSADGSPSGALVADANGDLFGLTNGGGANGSGEIFEIANTNDGYASVATILASLPEANNHAGALLIDGAGDLFVQTLPSGGAVGAELYELAKSDSGYASTLTTVAGLDGGGSSTMPGLATDSSGDLFGTALNGGPQQESVPNSTVYEITNTGFVPTSSNGGGGGGGTGGTTGETLTADDSAGQHLVGTPNDDTFFAGHNSVVMTGNGGDDTFVFQYEPWNAGSITDFTPGHDKLDLSALLTAAGYTGSDPVADGYVTFSSDGSGDTNVYFNPHEVSQSWPALITTLDGVSPTNLTSANTLGTAGPSSGGGGGTGGGTTGETLTANDTAGQQLVGTPNDDTFNAGHNSVVMTGDGGADTFVFQYLPWNAGSITDFNPAADVLNLKGIFAAIGYAGSNPVADGYLAFQSDGQGDTHVLVDPQGPATQIPITVTTLDHVDPSAIHSGDYIFA